MPPNESVNFSYSFGHVSRLGMQKADERARYWQESFVVAKCFDADFFGL